MALPSLTTASFLSTQLTLTYSDGSESVAHFHVLPPLASQVAAFGTHLSTVAWLPRDYPDPFGR